MALGLGAFDTPFQPVRVTEATRAIFAPPSSLPGLAEIERVRRGAPYLFAAQTSAVAAPYIYVTGEEVLPLGGYTGTEPAPSARAVASSILEQKFHLALVASPGASPGARAMCTTTACTCRNRKANRPQRSPRSCGSTTANLDGARNKRAGA